MLQLYKEMIKPLNDELQKSLGIRKIEVTYIPTELKSRYRAIKYNPLTKVTTRIYQFDPLGYISIKEARNEYRQY